MIKSLKKIDRKILIIGIAFVALAAALEFLFPYSGDDWAWGSSIGIDRLGNWFSDYNGRYAGNLMVLALTRSKLLRVIFKTVTYFFVVFLPFKISKSRNLSVFVGSCMLFVIIPKNILVQSYVWTSGFSNYIPPIVLVLAYLLSVNNIFSSEKPKYSKITPVISFIFGAVGCLFMENITLYCVALGFSVLIFCVIKFRHVYLTHLMFIAGTVAGSAIMFTNGAYRNIANGNDGYRTVSKSISDLIDTIFSHLRTIESEFIFNNAFVLVLLSVLLIILAAKNVGEKNKVKKIILLLSMFANMFSLVIIVYKHLFPDWQILAMLGSHTLLNIAAMTAFSVLYFVSLLAAVSVCVSNTGRCQRLWFEILSILVIVAPLLIVTPIGPRCLYPAYLLLTLIIVEIGEELLCQYCVDEKKSAYLSVIGISVALAAFAVYFSVYAPIYFSDVSRLESAYEQIESGQKTVTVSKLPDGSFVWCGDPSIDLLSYRYKLFYGIDNEIELVLQN